jgi:hypothetical protein
LKVAQIIVIDRDEIENANAIAKSQADVAKFDSTVYLNNAIRD